MVCAHLRTILGSGGTSRSWTRRTTARPGVEAVVRSRPDVVLMDLRMPGMDGLTAIERIGRLADPPAVVVLTTFDADQYVLRALRAGAAGFLVKSTPPEDLIGLVQVAAEGIPCCRPAAARRLIAASADRHSARDRARELVGSLTEREAEVLACLGEGLSNAQIAARLVPVRSDDQGLRVADAGQARLRQPHPGRAARPRCRDSSTPNHPAARPPKLSGSTGGGNGTRKGRCRVAIPGSRCHPSRRLTGWSWTPAWLTRPGSGITGWAGRTHFEADREAAEKVIEVMPSIAAGPAGTAAILESVRLLAAPAAYGSSWTSGAACLRPITPTRSRSAPGRRRGSSTWTTTRS